jgi:hypothetical protein
VSVAAGVRVAPTLSRLSGLAFNSPKYADAILIQRLDGEGFGPLCTYLERRQTLGVIELWNAPVERIPVSMLQECFHVVRTGRQRQGFVSGRDDHITVSPMDRTS